MAVLPELSQQTDPHLQSELDEIQEDLAAMKQEIQSLKHLSQPFLTKSSSGAKLSARMLELSIPRKPSRSSSVSTMAKWSWADPVDNGAGPGSYNVTTDIAGVETVSSYTNRPKAFISKTRHLSSEIEGKKGTDVPALTHYTPNTTLTKPQNPVVSFPQAEVKRLPHLEDLRKRSPGPIYRLEFEGMSGGRISSSKRDTHAAFVRNAFPSSQHYTFDVPKVIRSVRFGTGPKDLGDKQYVPGIERYMQGRLGELTANIPDPLSQLSGGSTLRNTGHAIQYNASAANPGAGTYPTTWIHSNKGKFSFPKAPRRIDVKMMGISHDVLRD